MPLRTPGFGLRGAKPPQTPHLNGRPQHLIEVAKRGRFDQMPFFSASLTALAPLTTVQPDDRPAAGPASPGRPAIYIYPPTLQAFRLQGYGRVRLVEQSWPLSSGFTSL